MRKLEQMTKLIHVLAKNKALLYECLAKGTGKEDQCYRILMGRILAVVEDERFQTWSQVKAWAQKNYHRQLRKCRPRQMQTSGCSPRVSFEDLVPVLRTSEIATNVQRLLDSVVDVIGAQELVKNCRHVLTGNGSPEDLKSCIFTHEFSGVWDAHIKKTTLDSGAENADNEATGRGEREVNDNSVRRSNADRGHVRSRGRSSAAETVHVPEKEPEHSPGPAPIVRSFADLNSLPSAAPAMPNPETEVLFGAGGLLRDMDEQSDRQSVDKESSARDTTGTQSYGNNNTLPTPKRKRRRKKKVAIERDEDPSGPSPQADAQRDTQRKDSPVPVPIPLPISIPIPTPTPTIIPIPSAPSPARRTPATLVEEYPRQGDRPTRPSTTRNSPNQVPRRGKASRASKRKSWLREVRPEIFYWSAGEMAGAPRANSLSRAAGWRRHRSPSRQESLPPAKDIRWMTTPPNRRRPSVQLVGRMPRTAAAQTANGMGARPSRSSWPVGLHNAPRHVTASTSKWNNRRRTQRPICPAEGFQHHPQRQHCHRVSHHHSLQAYPYS
ncbi:hypothetical protein F5Y10DRAFT_272450 [Nemania abortiva]|nr:hypothetical protein F5Y10DRAFT_272450 [Nemania abortiva]